MGGGGKKAAEASSARKGAGVSSPSRGRRRRRGGTGRNGGHGGSGNTSAEGCAVLSGTSGLSSRGLKVIIRLLPPTLTEEAFLNAVKESGMKTIDWHRFVPGSPGKRAYGTAGGMSSIGFQHSRCYMSFKSAEAALDFKKVFHGHRFVEAKNGMEYFARVERTLLQRVPTSSSRRKEKNKLEGTIFNDPDFKQFLTTWEVEAKTSKSTTPRFDRSGAVTSAVAKGKADDEVVVTPLMAELRAKRRERDGKKSGSKNFRRKSESSRAASGASKSKGGEAGSSGLSAGARPAGVDDGHSKKVEKMTILKRSEKKEPRPEKGHGSGSDKSKQSRRGKAKTTNTDGTNGNKNPALTKPKNSVTTPKILKPSKTASVTEGPSERLWVAKPSKKS